MAWSFKKLALLTGGVVVGGALCFITAGAAAPAIGAMVGSAMGLSGAAATSAGLAAIGGGALAVGGGGMAAGAAIITTAITAAGALLGGLGMGTVANFFSDSTKEFKEALHQQKDYAKAQQIIIEQEAKLRELKHDLEQERHRQTVNQQRIADLEKAIQELEKVVQTNIDDLRAATKDER